jgi:hypothetical protein
MRFDVGRSGYSYSSACHVVEGADAVVSGAEERVLHQPRDAKVSRARRSLRTITGPISEHDSPLGYVLIQTRGEGGGHSTSVGSLFSTTSSRRLRRRLNAGRVLVLKNSP